MINLKKIIALALSVVLILQITACGSSVDTVETQPEETVDVETETSEETEVVEEVQPEAEIEETQEAVSNTVPPLVQEILDWEIINSKDEQYNIGRIKTSSLVVLNDGYDNLQDTLDSVVGVSDEDLTSFKESIEMYTTFDEMEERDISSAPWFHYTTKTVKRSDAKVLSYLETINSFMGGVHPNYYYGSQNIDVVTGEVLTLEDVVTSKEDFKSALLESLNNHYLKDQFNADWENTVNLYFDNSEEGYYLVWVMTSEGIRVVFDPYEIGYFALGAIRADVRYADYPNLFNKEYLPEETRTCKVMEDYYDDGYFMDLDLDRDGEIEKVKFIVDRVYDDNYQYVEYATPSVSIIKGKEVKTITLDASLDIGNAYVLEAPDGNYYMYIDYQSENDWHSLKIIDLSETAEGPIELSFNDSGAFDGLEPFNPDYLCVQTRLQFMGTYSGYRVCYMGKNGQLIPYDDEYKILRYTTDEDYFTLTVMQDFKAYTYKSLDVKDKRIYVTIPAGTKLIPYSTDAKTYMTFVNEDGSFVDVYYDEGCESWNATINGIPESEVLDGIIYAG